MDEFVDRIKALPRAAGVDEVMMPGEPEQRRENERRRTGLPITDNVVADLIAEADKVGLSMPRGADSPLGAA